MSETDKPKTRYECEHCDLRTEVSNVKSFLSSVNKRQWFGITLTITTLLTAVGTLMVIIFKLLPAIAVAQSAAAIK